MIKFFKKLWKKWNEHLLEYCPHCGYYCTGKSAFCTKHPEGENHGKIKKRLGYKDESGNELGMINDDVLKIKINDDLSKVTKMKAKITQIDSMNREKAKIILEDYIDKEDGISLCGSYEFTSWGKGEKEITLDGSFSIKVLEAIVWWIKNN